MKTSSRLVNHARCYLMMVAESHVDAAVVRQYGMADRALAVAPGWRKATIQRNGSGQDVSAGGMR